MWVMSIEVVHQIHIVAVAVLEGAADSFIRNIPVSLQTFTGMIAVECHGLLKGRGHGGD